MTKMYDNLKSNRVRICGDARCDGNMTFRPQDVSPLVLVSPLFSTLDISHPKP